jgi:hypothetical protein
VLEFVVQYERQLRQFKTSMMGHTQTVEAIKKEGGEYTEEKWMRLSEVRMTRETFPSQPYPQS